MTIVIPVRYRLDCIKHWRNLLKVSQSACISPSHTHINSFRLSSFDKSLNRFQQFSLSAQTSPQDSWMSDWLQIYTLVKEWVCGWLSEETSLTQRVLAFIQLRPISIHTSYHCQSSQLLLQSVELLRELEESHKAAVFLFLSFLLPHKAQFLSTQLFKSCSDEVGFKIISSLKHKFIILLYARRAAMASLLCGQSLSQSICLQQCTRTALHALIALLWPGPSHSLMALTLSLIRLLTPTYMLSLRLDLYSLGQKMHWLLLRQTIVFFLFFFFFSLFTNYFLLFFLSLPAAFKFATVLPNTTFGPEVTSLVFFSTTYASFFPFFLVSLKSLAVQWRVNLPIPFISQPFALPCHLSTSHLSAHPLFCSFLSPQETMPIIYYVSYHILH